MPSPPQALFALHQAVLLELANGLRLMVLLQSRSETSQQHVLHPRLISHHHVPGWRIGVDDLCVRQLALAVWFMTA